MSEYIETTLTENEQAVLRTDTRQILADLFQLAQPEPGAMLVVGCSTSEILGQHIGRAGCEILGKIIAEEVLAAAKMHQIYAAAQCCEHLNRTLALEKTVAQHFGYQIVSAVPKPHAGGSFAAAFYSLLEKPVLVESVQADLGLDIGLTLIGMHLKRVAVPLRLGATHLGQAVITAAKTRPPLIGGERAQYQ
ncbi:MAG TPA: TIGR01440 family protein [Candidatus Avidehalobacter gallistercoris]|uniref:UPF0340 protein IAB00_01670 n=1 Tax=Candidatus Avidehalobacter gallistercoris TaxID=2840694 RepID=A0A9D1HIK7_9FIRM|nr:TIGR01440 family protein [Candidatus Avidehalobacter gallistercoris]